MDLKFSMEVGQTKETIPPPCQERCGYTHIDLLEPLVLSDTNHFFKKRLSVSSSSISIGDGKGSGIKGATTFPLKK